MISSEQAGDLVTFFYILLRDYIPVGQVEDILANHVEKSRGTESKYSNKTLALMAAEFAVRLINNKDNKD